MKSSGLESVSLYSEEAMACMHNQDGRLRMDKIGFTEATCCMLERCIGARVALNRARED